MVANGMSLVYRSVWSNVHWKALSAEPRAALMQLGLPAVSQAQSCLDQTPKRRNEELFVLVSAFSLMLLMFLTAEA